MQEKLGHSNINDFDKRMTMKSCIIDLTANLQSPIPLKERQITILVDPKRPTRFEKKNQWH